ncbi:MAG: peptidoglycan-binding protein [Clostridiales bacterium]|nr:peptidoglycan-binding protein [Clostridiales bacterium]
MKKLIAVLLISIIGVSLCLSGYDPVFAAPSPGPIYAKSSVGSAVVRIQMRLRELGYLNFKPTGSYKSMTVDAVKAFQTNCRDSGYEMQVDGRMGDQSIELLFRYEALRSSLSGISIPAGPKHGAMTLAKTGGLVSWSSVVQTLTPNTEYRIIDCYTGYELRLIFIGGENHAEMEPVSQDAMNEFMKICGKEYNYLKRPVVVVINGQEIAASIQCWPHGSDAISDNGMRGHVCVFFDGSLSHVGNLPDVEHNENIHKAMGQ